MISHFVCGKYSSLISLVHLVNRDEKKYISAFTLPIMQPPYKKFKALLVATSIHKTSRLALNSVCTLKHDKVIRTRNVASSKGFA